MIKPLPIGDCAYQGEAFIMGMLTFKCLDHRIADKPWVQFSIYLFLGERYTLIAN